MFLQVCTAKMNLGDEVDLEDYVSRPDKISAAEVYLFSLYSDFASNDSVNGFYYITLWESIDFFYKMKRQLDFN